MKATLDKDRRYLGFSVPDDCTLSDGRIINASGESPYHLRDVATLEPIDAAKVEAYRAEREEAHKAAEAKGEPMPPAPVKYVSPITGNLVSTKPARSQQANTEQMLYHMN